ncbi:DUF4296 domain-containing protein [Dysgonomonas massiliensis]|uniref:DUF4296 domain-containing protein n=1 Tax=Dysgonomonas massiliensis TaxID=2040292 RepID=UPI000C77C39E|nr:DUF4296 domain-containing protein [Dysgonomonas massiliensis]
MRKAGFILLVVSLLVMVSCSERPGNVLSKNEMIDVLYDLQLAQAMHDDYNIELAKTKEGKEAIMNSVLLKYNLSRADLDSSIVWYSDNLSDYKAINDSVTAKLRKQVDILRVEDNILRGINVDNNNTLPFYFYLDRSNTRKTFSLRESDMADKGGLKNFKLSFKVIGLNGVDRNIETGVYFVYKDTTIVDKMTLKQDSSYVVVKPDMPDSLLTQIQGFFRLPRISTLMPMKVYDVSYAQDSLGLDIDANELNESDELKMLKVDEKELKSAK